MHDSRSFSIPSIRSFVPEWMKPWIIICIVVVFQLSSGGIYLAAVSQMVGSLALMQEDIMMAGYASMVGMALTFNIMFRLKFRFCSKTALTTCAVALIVSNLIALHTTNVPLLVATSFIAGIFRMWATFECNSTIQLWLTPKRDLSIFFCFIYLLVQGCIQLSGLATIYMSVIAKWEYMHWLVIALLGMVILVVHILFRNYRSMRKIPLYGIDWLGALLWGLTVLSILFICIYGEHYDWFHSVYIRMAALSAIAMLVVNMWRASFIRHPYINNRTWMYKEIYVTLVLYIVVYILLSPSHLLEHIYMEAILGYDEEHTISLNFVVLFGVVASSWFTYHTFALRKWSYKKMTIIAFSSIVLSLVVFYLTVDFNQSKASLIVPIFLRTFGYVIIGICFLTVLSRIPFHHFPQSLSIQGFFSACISGVFGTAILGHIFRLLVKKNSMLLSTELDMVNQKAANIASGELYGMIQIHSVMVSIKELYGWLVVFGLFCLLILMMHHSTIKAKSAIHPTFRSIRRLVKRELRIDKKSVPM